MKRADREIFDCAQVLAVMHAEDALQAFAQQFPQAKIFDVWVEI